MRFERIATLLLALAPLVACDRSKAAPEASVPSSANLTTARTPSVTTPSVSSVTTPSAPAVPPGPRKLVWRRGADHDYALALDREGLARLSDAERAAVAYLATSIGSNCEWAVQPEMARDGGVVEKGKMRCELTDALGLGYQCEAKHKAFVMGWLGDDAPSSCAKIPTTAFSRTAFDALTLSREGDRIVVSYAAVHTDGPNGPTQSWSETIRFAPRGAKGLRIESRHVTKGKAPN